MAYILITEFMDTSAVQRLSSLHQVDYLPDLVKDPARLLGMVEKVDALIVRNLTQVRGDLLKAATRLKVVGRLGVGLDNIDVAACDTRGIRVIPATGANADSVAEYVLTAGLMLLRGIYQASARVSEGEWPRQKLSAGREASTRVMGILGFGDIGRRVARLAKCFAMQVIACDTLIAQDDPVWAQEVVNRVSFEQLLRQSDVLTLQIPLNDQTRNLIGTHAISQMKKGAILINTARGGIVDEAALVDALREGRLGGAALDVFAAEPLPRTPQFQGMPNLVLTPHVAGVTFDSNLRVSDMIAGKVIECLAT
jgi:(S)-sulfolactate dehydrogenase